MCEEKETKPIEVKVVTGKMEIIISVAAVCIALFGAIIAVLAFLNDKTEYNYKIMPEVETIVTSNTIKIPTGNDVLGLSSITLNIEERNNLKAAYIVDPKYDVCKLMDKDGSLEEIASKDTDFATPDITIETSKGEQYVYVYRFIVFVGLDGSHDISLIYTKSHEKTTDIHKSEGIELLELAAGHKNDEKYAGEREMAAKYKELVQLIKDFLPERV